MTTPRSTSTSPRHQRPSQPPLSSSQRVASYRQRQRLSGMVHLSLTVPAGEAAFFRELARGAQRRMLSAEDTSSNPAEGKPLPAAHLKIAQRWSLQTGLKLRLNRRGLKLGDLLARNIAHEITLAGWPVGRNLGSEMDLMARYGISRSILREAARLLEHQSIAVMRRGASGGLVVVRPDLHGVAYSAGVYLQAHHLTAEQLSVARKAAELAILELAAGRLDAAARCKLERALEFESRLRKRASGSELQKFHMLLAEIAGNPALLMFLDTLLRATRYASDFYTLGSKRATAVENVRRAHAAIAGALLQGSLDVAREAMVKYLDYVAASTNALRV